jgi:CxxC motif-containing protein (DUF1111 family)
MTLGMNSKKHLIKKLGVLLAAAVYSVAAFAQLPLTGGNTTTKHRGEAAFSQPAPNLPLLDQVDFSVGNSFFRNPWVIAPSSTTARDGLGPLFNANGCESCHINDGRGHAPLDSSDTATSMLIRLSIKPFSDEEKIQQQIYGPLNEPSYGGQFQDGAVPGVDAEGKIKVTWHKDTFIYPDGEKVTLREPEFTLSALAYGELSDRIQQSARIAPQMIGLGLLEQVAEQDVLANIDPDDANNDGISGRANWVWDVVSESTQLGRFGWKAGMPSLQQQNSSAFNGDIGITSSLFPSDHCTSVQTNCLNAVNGDTAPEKELQTAVLTAVTFYTRHIAVPMQRDSQNPQVLEGEQLFNQVGCAACHIPEFKTPVLSHLPALSEQTFHPFTDLLLHDMGESLADNREEYLADGQEWRTPPLWGTGYALEVNEQVALLHDGRAQSVEEAILWHGGEAQESKQTFVHLIKAQRDALIAFVNSL